MPGQTIIELLAAVFVITSGLVAVATLVTVTVRSQRAAEQTVIAYQLARESLEVARALRDNAFTTGSRPTTCLATCSTLPSGQINNDYNGTTELNPATGSWNFNYNGSGSQFSSIGNRICRSATTGVYYQRQLGCYAGDAYTPVDYRRRLTVDFICLNPNDNTECIATSSTGSAGCVAASNCGANYPQFIGHRVTSRVWMPNRGCGTSSSVAGCLNLVDYLYAWK